MSGMQQSEVMLADAEEEHLRCVQFHKFADLASACNLTNLD